MVLCLCHCLCLYLSLWWRSGTGELLMDACHLGHIKKCITFHIGYVTIKLILLKMRVYNTV